MNQPPADISPIKATDKPLGLSDFEWSGQVNRATSQGATFSLMLAMLVDDPLQRQRLVKAENDSAYANSPLSHHYRRAALASSPDDYANLYVAKQLLHQSESGYPHCDLRLWQAMHPEPLAQYDEAKRLPEGVLENCALHVQQRFQQGSPVPVNTDETLLHDLLPQAQHALSG